VNNWTKDAFVANRTLYNNDEALCMVLENAIWIESERLKKSVELIKDYVAKQNAWLDESSSYMNVAMTQLVDSVHARELSVIDSFVDYVITTIEDCSPLRHEMLLTTDAFVVREGSLLVPDPPVPVIPSLREYNSISLNDEQKNHTYQSLVNISNPAQAIAIDNTKDGAYSKDVLDEAIILNEDLQKWSHSVLSHVGPLGYCSIERSTGVAGAAENYGEFKHLMMPKAWRIETAKESSLQELTSTGKRGNSVKNHTVKSCLTAVAELAKKQVELTNF